MNGDLIVYWPEGWACTNESRIETHKELLRDSEGKILPVPAKQTKVVVGHEMYTVEGGIKAYQKVKGAFRMSDSDKKVSFRGIVDQITEKRIIISLIGDLEDKSDEILTKIKMSWQR